MEVMDPGKLLHNYSSGIVMLFICNISCSSRHRWCRESLETKSMESKSPIAFYYA